MSVIDITSMGDTERQKLRHQRITASRIPCILGEIARWGPSDVWREILEPPKASEPNLRMRRGLALEPMIADLYAEQTGQKPLSRKFFFQSKACPWLGASPDWILPGDTVHALVEGKTSSLIAAWESGVPDYVRSQVAGQLLVTGADWCDVAALIGDDDFRIQRLERGDMNLSLLLEFLEEWYEKHIRPCLDLPLEEWVQYAPPPASVDEAARLWPKSKSRFIIAVPVTIDLIDKLKGAKATLKEVQTEVNRCELSLKQQMGDADEIVSAPGEKPLVTWRTDKESAPTVDEKTWAKDDPDGYKKAVAKYPKQRKAARRFAVK